MTTDDAASGAEDGSDLVLEPVLDLEDALDPRAPRVRLPLAIGLTAAAAVGIVTIGVQARGGSLAGWDEAVTRWVLAHRGTLDVAVANVVTTGGATAFTLPAAALVGALALPRRPTTRARATAGLLLAGISAAGVYAGLLLNGATGRERPSAVDWAGAAGGPSFPSGHTTAATIFAVGCAWALSTRISGRRARGLVWAGAAVWAGAVGWTRVWLGVHWASDVIGGWLFATAWCAVALAVVAAARRRQHRARPEGLEPPTSRVLKAGPGASFTVHRYRRNPLGCNGSRPRMSAIVQSCSMVVSRPSGVTLGVK
jgi:undecaprenyl-diphosphatase